MNILEKDCLIFQKKVRQNSLKFRLLMDFLQYGNIFSTIEKII